MSPVSYQERSGRVLESFLVDKMTGLGFFIGAISFFFAGVAASPINFTLSMVLLAFAAICVGVSLWFIRKQ
jgi:hypothetical protein